MYLKELADLKARVTQSIVSKSVNGQDINTTEPVFTSYCGESICITSISFNDTQTRISCANFIYGTDVDDYNEWYDGNFEELGYMNDTDISLELLCSIADSV